MNQLSSLTAKFKISHTLPASIVIYIMYMALIITIWYMNGGEYESIGKNSETIKEWLAIPTLLGSAFLVLAITLLGSWKAVLFENIKAQAKWVWLFPISMFLIIGYSFLEIGIDKLTPGLILWGTLGAVGVGFGEEALTRGILLVGLRKNYTEGKSWLYSTILFSAMHLTNILFGLAFYKLIIQLILTFILGSGFYVARRISGTLILSMCLHGLWDGAIFLKEATGVNPSNWSMIVYPIAMICLIPILRGKWKEKIS